MDILTFSFFTNITNSHLIFRWVLLKAPSWKDSRENYLHSTQYHRLKPEANLPLFLFMLKCLSITPPELTIPIYLTVNTNQTILKICSWKFRGQAEGRNWQMPSKHWESPSKSRGILQTIELRSFTCIKPDALKSSCGDLVPEMFGERSDSIRLYTLFRTC